MFDTPLDPLYIPDLLGDLTLIEFSCIDDDGVFHEKTHPTKFKQNKYACGLYWFRRN